MPLPVFAGAAAGSTAVAAGGAQAGLWWLWRKAAPFLALVPGFSRIAKDELLDHERRARIYEMIRHNPGVRLGEVSSVLQIPWGSAMHHLRKLRADRLIMFKSVGAHKCYFLNGSGLSEQEMLAVSHLKGDTTQGVAAYIEGHPRTSLKELAEGLGISPPLASFHVAKLAKAGLVQKVRDGRATRLVLAVRLPPGHAIDPAMSPLPPAPSLAPAA